MAKRPAKSEHDHATPDRPGTSAAARHKGLTIAKGPKEPARLKIEMDWERAAAHVVRVPKPKKTAKKKRAKKN
jgi:hypothetical protein